MRNLITSKLQDSNVLLLDRIAVEHIDGRMISLFGGGAVIAALAVVAVVSKMRRRRRVAAGLRAIHGKVVLITGASSGLGEGEYAIGKISLEAN